MARLEMRFLGGLTLRQDGVSLRQVKSQKGIALFSYLAVSGREASRSHMAGLFWPDMPESRARSNLRTVLHRLKPLKSNLVITRQALAFDREGGSYLLDVAEFEEGTVGQQSIARLQQAVLLYQGDFLDGFTLPDAPLFDEWVLVQRVRLREMALKALQQLLAHFSVAGSYEKAIGYARQLLNLEPWHEETHRDLMRLLARSGQRSTALAQYELCRRLLADELRVDPAAATRSLYKQIQAGALGQEL